ncbi:hypothetical protein CALVIDRAFT_58619 [Calocera viscosa TUFC12733]|uniref:Uncharacterized protein n=1 Tax=Calocera viscosa (strain TUFC12733) TaxID=1330018 RepID=A0A167NHU0_CALVF|nr:hypothetical protein CALVIDRAFT_58619 [Calocera viscosa TUFC12733]
MRTLQETCRPQRSDKRYARRLKWSPPRRISHPRLAQSSTCGIVRPAPGDKRRNERAGICTPTSHRFRGAGGDVGHHGDNCDRPGEGRRGVTGSADARDREGWIDHPQRPCPPSSWLTHHTLVGKRLIINKTGIRTKIVSSRRPTVHQHGGRREGCSASGDFQPLSTCKIVSTSAGGAVVWGIPQTSVLHLKGSR